MSRKTLIFCLAVLSAMFVALGIAIAFLYSGTGDDCRRTSVSLKGASGCLAAVPSDAVLVTCSSRMDRSCRGILSSFPFPDSLSVEMENGGLASLKRSPIAVSLHYSGKLIPLYVIDVDGVSENALGLLQEKTDKLGYNSMRNGRYLLVSESDALVKSASRHLDIKVSIVDSPGFADALELVDGDDLVFVSHLHARKLLSAMAGKGLSRHSQFAERLSDWSAFSLTEGLIFAGASVYDAEADEFMTVLQKCSPAVSHVSDVLPSYTISAVSLPMADPEAYISAYKSFIDSRQNLHNLTSNQKALGAAAGIMPEDFFRTLKVKEVANASFKVDGKVERVNLIRTASKDADLIFKGNGITSLIGYEPAVHTWAYGAFAASVFGNRFSLEDESCFTYVDGWIISGSRSAIEDYVVRKSLNYSLTAYLSDASRADLLSSRPSVALVYCSLTEAADDVRSSVKPALARKIAKSMEADFTPVVLTVGKDGGRMTLNAGLHELTLRKTKAPVFERDTTVLVPAGPYAVKNSHTGKMNTFYQNAQKSLCLRDENGKDLWGVPFESRICGTAHNVDYFANGKLQIIFGAGSKIYIIDRLGRYVGGFPLDLGKEILLGPDIYDFSGAGKYNIMVLHKNNTVEMYNLKGKKPDAWKSIAPDQTIKSLPEKLVVGGKNFWIVRTSIQTLIYPFYGGDPLTVLDGDGRIRPDSSVKVVDDSTVQVSCYDGKNRSIKLK